MVALNKHEEAFSVAMLPVAAIEPSPINRHCSDDDPDIREIAASIREVGLLSPIPEQKHDEEPEGNSEQDEPDNEGQQDSAVSHELLEAALTNLMNTIENDLRAVQPSDSLSTAELMERKLRVCVWLGVSAYRDECDEGITLDDIRWNPVAVAWENAIGMLAYAIAASIFAEQDASLIGNSEEQELELGKVASTWFPIFLDTYKEKVKHLFTDREDPPPRPDSGV